MHDPHRKLCIGTISDDRSISTIIIKKSLKEILQISKDTVWLVVWFQTRRFNTDTH